MIVILRQNQYSSELVVLFDIKVAYIATSFQDGYLGPESAEPIFSVPTDVCQRVHRLRTVRGLQEKEGNGERKFRSSCYERPDA